MTNVNWGIIGCGDVTEIKSGPAFNKIKNSALVAVMRRDGKKAEDYATRHKVPTWYNDANRLINDPGVNAIYVATPPSSHEEYTIAALKAGKPVYVEKPMSISAASAHKMATVAKEKNIKLVVAHYRRAQPLFKKIKQLLAEKAIGEVRVARLELYKKPLSKEELATPLKAWRINSSIAGGGLFHDLSPHQLDLMYYFFGEPERASGIATNQAGHYASADVVGGNILFKTGVLFDGVWCFNTGKDEEKDVCEIIGDKGKIVFSFFEHKPVILITDKKTAELTFETLPHVQQPMIEKCVDYFLDEGPNPCSGEEGVAVMNMIDKLTRKEEP